MAKTKSTPTSRAADLKAARRAGGDGKQSHWLDRLRAEMKRRAKAKKTKS
jgi:hypothetical protein